MLGKISFSVVMNWGYHTMLKLWPRVYWETECNNYFLLTELSCGWLFIPRHHYNKHIEDSDINIIKCNDIQFLGAVQDWGS